MATVKFVSDNKKKKFLNSIEELIKKDPRLNFNIINRMLGMGTAYINTLYNGEKLNVNIYKKWFDNIYPSLKQRVEQYPEITDDVLNVIVKNAVSTQRKIIAQKMGILEQRVQAIATSGTRTKKLDIYDIVIGNPLYPKTTLQHNLPKYAVDIDNLIKKISTFGLTQSDISNLLGISNARLQAYRRPHGKIISTQRLFKSSKIIKDLKQLLTYAKKTKKNFISLTQAIKEQKIKKEDIQRFLKDTKREEQFLNPKSPEVKAKRELGCYIYATYKYHNKDL